MNDYELGKQKCIPAVLIYILQDDQVLMLHRNRSQSDIHFSKYNGLGGKIEKGEAPINAAIREIKEESGIDVTSDDLIQVGTIYFPNFKPKKSEDWLCYIYLCKPKRKVSVIEPKNNEGELVWIKSDQILNLNLWPGDREFILKVLNLEPFSATFYYLDSKLVRMVWENIPLLQ